MYLTYIHFNINISQSSSSIYVIHTHKGIQNTQHVPINILQSPSDTKMCNTVIISLVRTNPFNRPSFLSKQGLDIQFNSHARQECWCIPTYLSIPRHRTAWRRSVCLCEQVVIPLLYLLSFKQWTGYQDSTSWEWAPERPDRPTEMKYYCSCGQIFSGRLSTACPICIAVN